jgi:hypothetical protein
MTAEGESTLTVPIDDKETDDLPNKNTESVFECNVILSDDIIT